MNKDKNFYRDYDLGDLSKKVLLDDSDLAIGLARWNSKFGEHELAQDFDVLSLDDGEVAWELAVNSVKNGWGETDAAQRLKVLKLVKGRVAEYLAKHSYKNGWALTDAAQKLKVIELCDGKVAFELDKNSSESGWGKTFMGEKFDCVRNEGIVANGSFFDIFKFIKDEFLGKGDSSTIVNIIKKEGSPIRGSKRYLEGGDIYFGPVWKSGEKINGEREALKIVFSKNISLPAWAEVSNLDGLWRLVVFKEGTKFSRKDVFNMPRNIKNHDYVKSSFISEYPRNSVYSGDMVYRHDKEKSEIIREEVSLLAKWIAPIGGYDITHGRMVEFNGYKRLPGYRQPKGRREEKKKSGYGRGL